MQRLEIRFCIASDPLKSKFLLKNSSYFDIERIGGKNLVQLVACRYSLIMKLAFIITYPVRRPIRNLEFVTTFKTKSVNLSITCKQASIARWLAKNPGTCTQALIAPTKDLIFAHFNANVVGASSDVVALKILMKSETCLLYF